MLRALALYPNLMMNRKAPSLDDLLAGFKSGTFNKLEVERITFPSGAQLQGVKVDPNNPHDVQSLLNLVNSLSLPVNAPTSDFTPHDVPNPHQADKNGSTSLKLLELLDKYKLLNKTRSSATLKSYQTHIEEFSRFVKNRQVHLIGKGDVTLFLEHLAKSKNTPRTIENKIATVRALFNFAIKHGYYFDSNPASGRQLVSKTDKIKSGYEIYELDEIKALFKLEELRKYKQSHEFWVPLLGLLTGARVGEICKLSLDDIKKTSSGTNYIKIKDSKTIAGVREIPLHPFLFELGFQDFIKDKKNGLFPYLIEIEGRGNGSRVSKFWKRHMERYDVNRDRLVFHSLRKFLNDYLMSNGMPIEPRCQLLGHELDNVNVSTYSNKFNVDKLAELAFPIIDKMLIEIDIKSKANKV